jgi:hypothetical protein
MKPAPAAVAAAALAAMMLAPSHLAAQTGDPIAEAFERGRNSGTTPLTRGEKIVCAGHWGSWAELLLVSAIDPTLKLPAEGEMDDLPLELRDEAAFVTGDRLIGELLAQGVGQAELVKAIDAATDKLMAALDSDGSGVSSLRYFETLGTCLPPSHASSR